MNGINPALFAITTKFPDLREEFINLFKHSEAFREVCLDYRKCVKAHKYWSRSTDTDALRRKREYEEFLSELEEELLQSIQKKRMNSNYEKECVMQRKFVAVVICLFFCAPMLLVGCAGMTPAQKGAVGGAGVGAIAGQLAGGTTKATMIGAGVGALGGALLNDAQHKNR